MALESGTTLGHYEITDQIGKGGMGEVYRARDTKLGREVAIKTLPAEFAEDADRLSRFEREAKLLASLNHPNIAAIYGLEAHKGSRFLVLELVEGDTLADRLKRGAIPVEESLKLALQIAEALETAHEKGVIHRDLKPANIKVTPEGKVKVLDFGLAKAFSGDESDASLSNSPTLSMAATQQGVILGTASYMSPEQAKGRATDRRTDIWSFGCVLYEMITGRQSFGASDVSEALAAVIRADPDWNTLPANLNPRLKEVLERCLEKDLKERYHDIADARVDIQRVLEDPGGELIHPVAQVAGRAKRSGAPWVVATALIVGVLAGIGVWTLKPPERGPVMHLGVDIPEGTAPEPVARVISISRDGTRVAYAGGGNQQVYLKNIGEDMVRPVEGAGGQYIISPVFSPDGNWLAYKNEQGIVKIPVTGGRAQPVIEDLRDSTLSWDDREMILYAQPDGIWQVSANGGPAELIVPAVNSEVLASPSLLPDGDSILFTSTTATGSTRWDAGQISVYSIGADERKSVWMGGSDARYVASGHLVYAQGTTLMALPFDLDRLEVTENSPVRMVEGVVRTSFGYDTANYEVSANGMLVYLTGRTVLSDMLLSEAGLLTIFGSDGTVESVSDEVRGYVQPRVSPDGKRIAVEVHADDDASTHIYIVEVATGIAEQLTFDGTRNLGPVWTADSQSVVFTSDRIDGQANAVFIQRADGEGAARPVYEHNRDIVTTDLSPDGILAFVDLDAELVQRDIWTVDITDSESASPFVATAALEGAGRFSSDGRWIAYVSDESGELRVYVQPYPSTGASPQQVFDGNLVAPVWSPDDAELYSLRMQFSAASGLSLGLVSTPVRVGADFSLRGRPQPVPGAQTGLSVPIESVLVAPYDVLPDGSGLLAVTTETADGPEQSAPKIKFVVNWSEELKERVPVP